MYQSSAAFTELVQKDSRTFKSKLIIGENEIESGIKSIILKVGSNSGCLLYTSIFQGIKARNPDCSVNYTELRLV